MIDYINGLKKEIEIIKGKINTEENGFKVVDLKLELSELMYKINYCFDLVFKSFSKEKIEEFALEFIPAEKKMKADEEANNFNEIIIKNSMRRRKSILYF